MANLTALDKAFSLYIRQRDAKNGIVKCISCGKLVPWKESDAGHFYNRRFMSIRYDEDNCHAQCRSCNRFSEGNIQGYTKGITAKIGKSKVDLLEIKKYNTVHMTQFEVGVLTKIYKTKIKEFNK